MPRPAGDRPYGDAQQGTPLCRRLRERVWARVKAGAKPVKGVDAKPGTEWLKPGVVGRVRHLKGEEALRHATLRAVGERKTRTSVLRHKTTVDRPHRNDRS